MKTPELTAQFAQVRAILDSLPVGLVIQDDRGNVIVSNALASEHLRLPGEEIAAWLPTAPVRSRITSSQETQTPQGSHVTYSTTREHIRVLDQSLVVSTSVDVTEHKAREDNLWRCAFFDELTGLPNRRLMEEQVNICARRGSDGGDRFALVFIDLDHFKHINDFYGHAAGDDLLIEIAKRLSRNMRESDMLSRISGDEFLLLLFPIASEEHAVSILEELLARLRRPIFVDGFEILPSASAGMSVFPDHGLDYGSLRHNADIAMYKVKGVERGRLAMFNIGMQQEAVLKMESEQRLRQAIFNKQIFCAYQPKVHIRTQEIEGVETLVRLRDDQGFVQMPASFIGLAVELGLIDELTHIFLEQIRQSIDVIDDVFGHGVRLSINVAAKQAADYKFMMGFAEAMKATGFPERFMVEITEDAFISKSKFQTEILPMLRNIGVGISIDDFGIGYSSLSALADITADEIKIDRSFIADIHKRPRSQGILKAIESLSEALNMKVIAEGVETFEEVAYLQAATKIKFAQGFYFSKPRFIDEFKHMDTSHSSVREVDGSRAILRREPFRRAGNFA